MAGAKGSQIATGQSGAGSVRCTRRTARSSASRSVKLSLPEKAKTTPAPADRSSNSSEAPAQDRWPERLRAHRTRQASVASILDTAFGRLADCSPELWERRAYLMLVGMVYERLGAGEQEIPTDELVALAKVLAENRRVEVRSRAGDQLGGAVETGAGNDGRLPKRFGDIVRQVYGISFQTPQTQRTLPGERSPSGGVPAVGQSPAAPSAKDDAGKSRGVGG